MSILFYREKNQKFTNMFQRLRQDIVFKWLFSGQFPRCNSTCELYRKWFDVALAYLWLQRVHNLPIAFVWFKFFMWISAMWCHDLPSMIYGLVLSDNTQYFFSYHVWCHNFFLIQYTNCVLILSVNASTFLRLELSSWFHKLFSQVLFLLSLLWRFSVEFHL